MVKIYVLFIELCMKGGHFFPHEGEVSPIKM
jgi:hypothetical protein